MEILKLLLYFLLIYKLLPLLLFSLKTTKKLKSIVESSF